MDSELQTDSSRQDPDGHPNMETDFLERPAMSVGTRGPRRGLPDAARAVHIGVATHFRKIREHRSILSSDPAGAPAAIPTLKQANTRFAKLPDA